MRVFLSILFFAGFSFASAQSIDFNWPEDRLTAEKKNRAYRIALEEGRFRDAADNLYWLLVNSPELSVSIYQNGTKIYEHLALNEPDVSKAAIYADSTLLLFDLRMKYYGEEEKVRNFKAYSSFKMFSKDENHSQFLLSEYDSLYSQVEVSSFNLIPYGYVIRSFQKEDNTLSRDQLIVRYNSIQKVIVDLYGPVDQISDSKQLYTKIKVDDIFFELLGYDCPFISKETSMVWVGRSDDDLAKNLFKRLNDHGCNSDLVYLNLAEHLNSKDPQLALSYNTLAEGYKKRGDLEKAEQYLLASIDIVSDKEIQAKIFIDLAEISLENGDKKKTAYYLNESLKLGPSKVALNSLGNLYYTSVDDCSGINPRFMYILAYEKYEKAGNDKMMVLSKEQFPSKEELFQMNLKVGDSIHIDCWVDEDIKLQSRD